MKRLVWAILPALLTGCVVGPNYGGPPGVASGEGLAKATELARRIVANAPLANFAILHALPRIAEAAPEQGLLMEAMTAGLVQSDPEAKSRIMDFLEKRAGKVREG